MGDDKCAPGGTSVNDTLGGNSAYCAPGILKRMIPHAMTVTIGYIDLSGGCLRHVLLWCVR